MSALEGVRTRLRAKNTVNAVHLLVQCLESHPPAWLNIVQRLQTVLGLERPVSVRARVPSRVILRPSALNTAVPGQVPTANVRAAILNITKATKPNVANTPGVPGRAPLVNVLIVILIIRIILRVTRLRSVQNTQGANGKITPASVVAGPHTRVVVRVLIHHIPRLGVILPPQAEEPMILPQNVQGPLDALGMVVLASVVRLEGHRDRQQ